MVECPAAGPAGEHIGEAAPEGAQRHRGPPAEAASLQSAPSEGADAGGELFDPDMVNSFVGVDLPPRWRRGGEQPVSVGVQLAKAWWA